MVKKVFITSLFFLLSNGLSPTIGKAQIYVGLQDFPGKNIKEFDSINLQKLKSTTTLFRFPTQDSMEIMKYQKVLEETWTLTKFKIISLDEKPYYSDKDGFSFFE